MPLIQELRLYLTIYSIDDLLGQNYMTNFFFLNIVFCIVTKPRVFRTQG